MKCPHCTVAFAAAFTDTSVGWDKPSDTSFTVRTAVCPTCERLVIQLLDGQTLFEPGLARSPITFVPKSSRLVFPRATARVVPPSVVEAFAEDYREAALVLPDSPKASAALSRRCLQHLLREKAGVKKSDLADEIDQVLASKQLPSHLSTSLDAVRSIGNFAAHPTKSKSTGEIVEVEAGEAEWNLDVLDGLFDFYFVQPAITKARHDALNKKLVDAGKPPI